MVIDCRYKCKGKKMRGLQDGYKRDGGTVSFGRRGRESNGGTTMTREIKFRGKRVDNGEWITGNVIGVDCSYVIAQDMFEWVEDSGLQGGDWWQVIPETIGQYTGLRDRDKGEIFRNDIIDGSYINPLTKESIKRLYLVVFENGCYIAKLIGKSPYGDTQLYFVNEKCKVIGTIHDNPELLEAKK